MSTLPIILMKGEPIDPISMPAWYDNKGSFEVVKQARLNGFLPLVWSPKIKRWIYVVYDQTEMKRIRSKFPKADCFTLLELYDLKNMNLDSDQWQRLAQAKIVFSAICKISNKEMERPM